MHQLNPLLRQAVFGNVGTMVVFRVGSEDAVLLARELETDLHALTGTPAHQAWLKQGNTPCP